MRKLILALLILLLPSLSSAQNNKIAVRPIGQMCYNSGGTGGCLAFSATPIFDAGLSNTFKITLTANVTSSTMIGLEAGQFPIIEVCQDGTGSRTFAFPAQFAGAIAVLAGANACIAELFYFDGTTANIITTTTAGGGGAGTINSGTGKCFTWYATTGTTVSNDCNLDDGLTTAAVLTYAGAGGISALQFNSTAAGGWVAIGTESTCSGATALKDVICAGDLTSHTAQVSNNGDSFRSIAAHESTSPVPGGPLVAGTFPRMIATARGTSGQPFLEGSAFPGFGGFGQLDLSLSTNVINRLPKLNQTATTVYNDQVNTFAVGGSLDLSASTVVISFRLANVAGATATTNGAERYDTTSNNYHFGMNGADALVPLFATIPPDSRCVRTSIVSGNLQLVPATGDCSVPGGAGAISGLTAATAANSPNNGDNAQTWNWLLTTAGKHAFTFTENSASTATGTPYLIDIHSIAASTVNPLIVTALGTANGIAVLKSGFLTSLGTGGVDSNLLHCDVTDGTKCAKLVLSGITTATTRNITVPDAASTVVVPDTGASNNFLTAISASGAISKAQPAFTNISGTATAAQIPSNVKIRDIGTSWGDTTGSALTSGSIVYVTVPFACTISAWNINVDGGTATIDIWKIATGTAIPTVTNTITASALPAISTGTSIHSTTLTAWTTAVAANDIFGFQLKTVATAKYVSIDMECDQ